MGTNEELIARLRAQSTEIGDRADVEELMNTAADRLAALTAHQEGDARERIARALCEAAESKWEDLSEEELRWHFRDADAILAAFPVLSRTTSPDAATDDMSVDEFSRALGFADEQNTAKLRDIVEPIQYWDNQSKEHFECPVYCGGCGEKLAATVCEHCCGSGADNAASVASGAYSECGWCAGQGKIHAGCAEATYAELVAERDAAFAAIERSERCYSRLSAEPRQGSLPMCAGAARPISLATTRL